MEDNKKYRPTYIEPGIYNDPPITVSWLRWLLPLIAIIGLGLWLYNREPRPETMREQFIQVETDNTMVNSDVQTSKVDIIDNHDGTQTVTITDSEGNVTQLTIGK